jgi:hypothetical protein
MNTHLFLKALLGNWVLEGRGKGGMWGDKLLFRRLIKRGKMFGDFQNPLKPSLGQVLEFLHIGKF